VIDAKVVSDEDVPAVRILQLLVEVPRHPAVHRVLCQIKGYTRSQPYGHELQR
jgi:hypothetical protein